MYIYACVYYERICLAMCMHMFMYISISISIYIYIDDYNLNPSENDV